MTNKKDLKRTINNVCADLFAECMAASYYCGKPKEENVKAILAGILHMRDDFVRRISHPEPGMKPHLYYKDLKINFSKQVLELTDQIINLD